jgi:hypothetical protein
MIIIIKDQHLVGSDYFMNFSILKRMSIPEGSVKKIEVSGITIWEQPSSYKNWVLYSTEADDTTIYNGGLGYNNGYRIRSGGAEGATEYGSHTGYIPAKAGYVIRLSGWNAAAERTETAINMYDSTHTNIGQVTPSYREVGYGNTSSYKDYAWKSVVENPTGVYIWVIPSDSRIAYIRVSGYTLGDGSKMIVTVNEPLSKGIPSGYTALDYITVPDGAYINTGILATEDLDAEGK